MLARPGLWSKPPAAATAAATAAAATRYQNDSIASATPAELTGMLFAKALEKMDLAKGLLEAGKPGEANPHLTRAQDIVSELRSSLNLEAGELSLTLDGVYTWVLEQLVTATVKGDLRALAEARARLAPVASAWNESVLNKGPLA